MSKKPVPRTIHVPDRSKKRLTTSTGPPMASAVQATAVRLSHSQNALRPNSSIDSVFVSRPIAQNSTEGQPRSCATFRTEGAKSPSVRGPGGTGPCRGALPAPRRGRPRPAARTR